MNNYNFDDAANQEQSNDSIPLIWFAFMVALVIVGSLAMPVSMVIVSISHAIKHSIGWNTND